MKSSITFALALNIAIAAVMAVSVAAIASEPVKAPASTASAAENTNCVKKDKTGKCPPLPDSPKPTPKKKVETK